MQNFTSNLVLCVRSIVKIPNNAIAMLYRVLRYRSLPLIGSFQNRRARPSEINDFAARRSAKNACTVHRVRI